MSHLQLDQSLQLHGLNKHLKQCGIPLVHSFSDITPSIFILIFEHLLKVKIPYVKRNNIEIKDYMHNLKCLKAYLMEMGLRWLKDQIKELDLWDLIDVGTDEVSLKAIGLILDIYDSLKSWIEKEESKNALHTSYDELLKGDGMNEIIEDNSSEEEKTSFRGYERKADGHFLESVIPRGKSNLDRSSHIQNREALISSHHPGGYKIYPDSSLLDLSSDEEDYTIRNKFTRLTSEKKWKEAANLLRELEDRTNRVKKKTSKLLDLGAEQAEKLSVLGDTTLNRHNHSSRDRTIGSQTGKNENGNKSRYEILDDLSMTEDEPLYKEQYRSEDRKSDLKSSSKRTILNNSSIRRDPELSLSLRSPQETSRLKQIDLEQTLGVSETELNEKMESLLKSRKSLKFEKQQLEEERKLYSILNSKSSSTKKKTKGLTSRTKSRAQNLTGRSRKKKAFNINMYSKKSDITFNEFRRLYEFYLDRFLNGISDVKPTLAVRNYLRDRKIEEIRHQREKQELEERINRMESSHQRAQERAIEALMKKIERTEKVKQRFEKEMQKELASEISQKRNEKQQVLESYYKTQVDLLQDLMQKTESDAVLQKRVKKWARELLDSSRELSKTSRSLSKSLI